MTQYRQALLTEVGQRVAQRAAQNRLHPGQVPFNENWHKTNEPHDLVGSFSDHLFAASRNCPRLIETKIRALPIAKNRPDGFRVVTIMAAGVMSPSLLQRNLLQISTSMTLFSPCRKLAVSNAGRS
jgi:hypothetical protein